MVEFDCLDSKSYPKHSAARGDGETSELARSNGRSHDMTLLASEDSITFTFKIDHQICMPCACGSVATVPSYSHWRLANNHLYGNVAVQPAF